jgi:predicted dehydrogenase
MKRNGRVSRRNFVKASAAAGIGYWVAPRTAYALSNSPNEKLNIAMIGTYNRAAGNLQDVSSQNIVVLCDVDDGFLAKAKEKFPKADTTNDFRKAVERKDIDAVVIATPDHTHAVATMAAFHNGKHVYCEKPLTHDVFEARTVTDTARKLKKATQLGTQIHALDNYRRVVELIETGAIGPVREVFVWNGRDWGGGDRPKETPPVPKTLHWDLWLGPAPERPYNPTYHPFSWRKWWDFGNGSLGDMGCHYIDVVFWALKLRYPTRVVADAPESVNPETCPLKLHVEWEFPARGDLVPVKMHWYDTGRRPDILKEKSIPEIGDGVLFVGDKGMLLTNYVTHKLLPDENFKDFKKPDPYIPKSIGHHAEWIEACKNGTPTTCQFEYSGPLTESVLLGLVAYRVGKPIEWDSANLKAVNCPEADEFIRREYRKGWSL